MHSNCKRYCGNPHHQQEDLREPLSRKKQKGDILKCFSSRLCDSGLFRETCELFVCFVIGS